MKKWISSAVVYQVNLRALAARKPRNPIEARSEREPQLSPLAYLARHLEEVLALGVNCLYLMPPFPIGKIGRKGIGSPYASRDFSRIEAEYGTRKELATLVRKAHRLDCRVILDITPNHTSRDHVWTRRHPEYYVQAKDGTPSFDLDWSDTAKLDYRQPGLRKAMLKTLDYWLGFVGRVRGGQRDGVDGFRLDMAHFINDRSFWDEAMPALKAMHPERELLFLAECYGADNNMDLFQRGMPAAYDDDFYKCCLYSYAVDAHGETVVLPDSAAAHEDAFRHHAQAFASGGIAAAFREAISVWEERLAGGTTTPCLARYTDNHDEGRGVYRFGPHAVRAVNALAFLAPHTIPFILTGQEYGALNRPSIHEHIGTCDKGRRVLREDGSYRQEEGIEFEGNLFARTRRERALCYTFYRRLIRLRAEQPALREGSFSVLDVGEDAAEAERSVVAFERRLGESVVRCAVNMGAQPRRLRNARCLAGKVLYGAMPRGVLPAFSAVVTRGAR